MGLIEKNDNGSWKLKGVEWSQIKPGAVITDQVWEKLYGALWKLKDYEETGFSPDQVSELQDETQEQARQMLERVARLSDEIERMKGEERQQWIPVAEKLPEPETYILVSFDNYTLPDIATYRVDDDGSGAFYPGDEDYTYLSTGFLRMHGCRCRSRTGQKWKKSLLRGPAGKTTIWEGLKKSNKVRRGRQWIEH